MITTRLTKHKRNRKIKRKRKKKRGGGARQIQDARRLVLSIKSRVAQMIINLWNQYLSFCYG